MMEEKVGGIIKSERKKRDENASAETI